MPSNDWDLEIDLHFFHSVLVSDIQKETEINTHVSRQKECVFLSHQTL